MVGGCAPIWRFDYDEACRQGRRQDRDVFIFYKDPLDVRSGRMRDVIEGPSVAPLLNDAVRCMLVPSYRPNRKFVAQYGVDQPPALIVVHPDGTYHALSGMHDAEAVRVFLASTDAPGEQPMHDIGVPRRVGFEYFNIAERAEEIARRQNRYLFIIYKWWLHPDSTELIRRASRPDVARYFAETVNCILDWDYLPNRRYVARYGVTKFPAMIMVAPDGRYQTLQGVPGVERIVRFALSARRAERDSGPARSRAAATPLQWYLDHDSAVRTGQRQERNVLIFFHSVFSDESNAAALMLVQAKSAALLTSTVNCRLDWSDRKSRARMAQYGLEAAPALVLVHPDGTYVAHRGPVTMEELRTFLGRRGTEASPSGETSQSP